MNTHINSFRTPSPAPLTYTVAQAAVVIGCSPASVYRLIARRLLRPVPGLRHKLLPRRQVEDFCNGANDKF